eukprot:351790-Chlamydomonas_euryale.AAC.5
MGKRDQVEGGGPMSFLQVVFNRFLCSTQAYPSWGGSLQPSTARQKRRAAKLLHAVLFATDDLQSSYIAAVSAGNDMNVDGHRSTPSIQLRQTRI